MTANDNRTRILVVEDDPSILLGLRMNLENEGYEVGTAEDGEEGLRLVRESDWDLVVLDIMLPRKNGYEVVVSMRSEQNRTPVLMLSARTAEVDMVMGLDLGADDYVTKPFSVGELLARIRAVLRRRRAGEPARTEAPPQVWRFGDVVANPDTREVRKAGASVDLTATEFDVLSVLARARGRILSRRQIMDSVWGPDHHGTERTIDNFIAQLRAKLESDPTAPSHLVTVRGVGYRLVS